MPGKYVSERNLKFLLYEVFDTESLTRYAFFEDHNRKTFDLILDTALRISRDILLPHLQDMDKDPPKFVDGQVKVHPMVREFMQESGEGGWISAGAPYDFGGQQLPITITAACHFVMAAANYSASVYPILNTGAAHLIESFGSEELAHTYVSKLFLGEWQGTMALTEPQAGSSLSDITTEAEPTADGYYRVRGQKIFISAGDHDGVDNVVHLMLARIKGAPRGVKGISLFVVPKKRPAENGELVSNDLHATAVYHKLGYRGTPITQLSMGDNGDCRGFLVGEPHKGLSYMFQMMNEARIEVGMGAAAIASAAYYASLEYASERPQGRRVSEKDPNSAPVRIIEHPDVKRMLLFQRAVVEGSLSLILHCCKYRDLTMVSEGEKKEQYSLLLDLLTPIAKTYPSEMGVVSVSQGLQCLGGYGYCDEFPLEQYYRDVRIHPIHEGTTGIQGLDLLGRKIVMKNGKAAMLFVQEVNATIHAAMEDPILKPYAKRLEEALGNLQKVTTSLVQIALEGDVEHFLADSTLYLELFGIVTIAWQWLLQGISAQQGLATNPPDSEHKFYTGKLFTMRYFFHYELPKIQGLATRLMEADGLTLEMDARFFAD